MRTYVVNLRRRPDRRARMERILPPEWEAEYTTDWPGPRDGQDIDPDHLVGFSLFPWPIASDNPWWNRPIKPGEIGCAVSHLLIWHRAAAAGADPVLILEDDAVLVDDCPRELRETLARLQRLDPRWDLLYVGRWRQGPDQLVGDGLVRPGYSYCTYGYLLSAGGLQKVLAAGYEDDLVPVDEFLPALYMDHPRPDVRQRYRPCLRAYGLVSDLVFELPKAQAGSDTELTAARLPAGANGYAIR